MNVDPLKQKYLSLLPDLPRWVETRALLLNEKTVAVENSAQNGVVVWSAHDELGSVVGEPDSAALERAAQDISELLAFPENVEAVRRALPTFEAESANLYSAPDSAPAPPGHPCRQIGSGEIEALEHLPAQLHEELTHAAEGGATMVAALDGTLPVAFCYVASETETLWDVSIDTVESHRRRGYAAAAVRDLMQRMSARGKSAVWGAVASNHASMGLARHLGFEAVDHLWFLVRPEDAS